MQVGRNAEGVGVGRSSGEGGGGGEAGEDGSLKSGAAKGLGPVAVGRNGYRRGTH